MRTRFVKAAVMFLAITLLFSSALSPAAEDYNDGRFSTYINMGDNAVRNNYSVPNMFRQDAPFAYMEKFPLVVNGGTEYVPLSMFILYSYIEARYNGLDDNFYMVNTRNGNYISFNIDQGIAYNHNGELMKTEVKIYHGTRYIPARKTAEALGMSWEVYDNPLEGTYAFRISSGTSKFTLSELLAPYLSSLSEKEEEQEEIKPNDRPSSEKDEPTPEKEPEKKPVPEVKPTTPEVKPEPEKKPEPLEKLKSRRLSVCFTDFASEKRADALYALSRGNIKAAFSLTKEEILQNPSAVRTVYTGGHALYVTANPNFAAVREQNADLTNEELYALYAKEFVYGLEEANEALKYVLKLKTRICTLPYGLEEDVLNSKAFREQIAGVGYLIYEPTVKTGDDAESKIGAYGISSRVKNKLTGGNATEGFDVKALFCISQKTYTYITDIASLVNKYDGLSFFNPMEYELFNG